MTIRKLCLILVAVSLLTLIFVGCGDTSEENKTDYPPGTTDELYSEKIRLDEEVVKYHIDRATDICNSPVMPPKKSENPSWYECKLCQFYNFCHKQNVEISEELLTWY